MKFLCTLLLCGPLLAQTTSSRSVYLDIHRASPSLEGHFNGTQDGQPVAFDLQGDLGLEKDSAKLGAAFEYQGPRFGVELAADEQDYKGFHRLENQITIKGQDYQAGTDLTSKVVVKSYTLNWTIRIIKPDPWWIGVDVGARMWDLDLKASGYDPVFMVRVEAPEQKVTLPIPQLGLSAGFHAFERRLVVKGFYHLLSRSGASYTHLGADARLFPIKWLGVRAFYDRESFKVPKGSIEDDLEAQLDRSGTGLGLILRF